MKKNLLFLLLFSILACCSSIREKAGLVKYQPDEYQVTSNPSLDVPPEFNIYSPEEIIASKRNSQTGLNTKLSEGEKNILQNLK